LTTPDQAEAEVKAAMVKAAARVVCLVDHSKFGLSQLCQFASLDVVDVVVTDSGLEQDLADELAAAGPEVIRA
jgi:DeoR family fructose operon transcriptional repressor